MLRGPGVAPVVQDQEAMPRPSVVEEGVAGVQVTASVWLNVGPADIGLGGCGGHR